MEAAHFRSAVPVKLKNLNSNQDEILKNNFLGRKMS